MRPYKRPYNVKSPINDMNNSRSLKVINFQAIDRSPDAEHEEKSRFQMKTQLPKLKSLNARRFKIVDKLKNYDSIDSNDSKGFLIQEKSTYKNQHSIGHKHIKYHKKGRKGYIDKIYSPPKRNYHMFLSK